MANQATSKMARELKKASITHGTPLWARLAEYALKPSIARRDINLKRIGQLTKAGDTVIFPGKVLGTGAMPHKITLCPFAISAQAAAKLQGSGGRLVSHADLIGSNPTGRGVVLLG